MKNNQKGFNAVEIILVITVLGLIGAVGWLVYDRNKTTKSESSPPVAVTEKSAVESSTKPKDTTKYLEIKEWGVKVQLTAGLEDAYYAVWDNNNAAFGVGTKTLTALDHECAPNINGAGYLFRQTITEHDTNMTKDDPRNYPVYSAKIGNYYYQYSHTVAACSSNDSTNLKQASYSDLFQSAFKNLKATD